MADGRRDLRLQALPFVRQPDREIEAAPVDRADLNAEGDGPQRGRSAAVSGHAAHASGRRLGQQGGDLLHVLVAPAAQIDQDDLVRPEGPGALDPLDQGVGALQGGNDALPAASTAGRPPAPRRPWRRCSRSGPGRGKRRARARPRRSPGRPRPSGCPRSARRRPAGSRSCSPGTRPAGRRRSARHARRGRMPAAARLHARSSRTPGSSRKSKNSPIALLPPPTQAISSSGSRPSRARICSSGLAARSPGENPAPSSDRDARRRPCRGCNGSSARWSPSRASPR